MVVGQEQRMVESGLSKPAQFVGLTISWSGCAMLWKYDLDQEQRTDPRSALERRTDLSSWTPNGELLLFKAISEHLDNALSQYDLIGGRLFKRTTSSSKRIFQRSAKSGFYIRDPDQLHIGMINVLFRDSYMIPVRMLGFP